jgi:predicted unusual protein kinase regulating ubiquinone biosynthesis (AarF/ABC1/UbiB family)
MWVAADGNIVAVDFGIMGRLDWPTRRHLADMLIATLDGDYHRLAAVYMEAGYLPQSHALDVFAQALRSVCEPIAGRPLNEISFARLLAQLLRLTESFELPVQPQLLLLQKNMLMAEGVSRRLDPSLNIWTLAQPLIDAWMRENRGPEARLREGAEDILRGLRQGPDVERQHSHPSGEHRQAGATRPLFQPLGPADRPDRPGDRPGRPALERLAISVFEKVRQKETACSSKACPTTQVFGLALLSFP